MNDIFCACARRSGPEGNPEAHYGDYQNAIYGAGLSGVLPGLPVEFATLERCASAATPKAVPDYVQDGHGDLAAAGDAADTGLPFRHAVTPD